MRRSAILIYFAIFLISVVVSIGEGQPVYTDTLAAHDPFTNLSSGIRKNQSNSIYSSQNALWNDQVYFEWSTGSIVSWKVDNNGNKDPRDDVDLISGAPVGNSIDLGWTDPEHALDHNFFTTGTDTSRGHHSAATNVASQIIKNENVGSVLIRGDLGPNARFQIRYTLYVNDPAIYAQVAIVWTRPTTIGFVGFGAYSSYPSVRDTPDRFLLGNATEFRIDEMSSVAGWYVGTDQRAQFAAFRNSYTRRIIGMAAKSPGLFEVSGEVDPPWGRGLTYFFKYRGRFSKLQPSFTNEFKLFSDNSNSYQAFLARKTEFPPHPPLSISFISPHAGDSVRGTVRIKIKVDSNIVVSSVTLFFGRLADLRIDITSNYDPSVGHYYYDWETTNELNGEHVLIVRVTDIAGNHGTSTITLSVTNLRLFPWLIVAVVTVGLFGSFFFGYKKRARDLKQRQARIQVVKQRELELESTGRLRELPDLAKNEILSFQDLAERYAVSRPFIQRTIESFVSKGALWGIATDEVFISVDFAISTLKRLSKFYRRITWQSLMEEFKLRSEKDLKVLLIQISHSQEIALLIDEIEKSVQLQAVEVPKPTKQMSRSVMCPSCGNLLDPKVIQCEHCGSEFPQCIVCHLPILDDFTKTPCCGSPAHSVHLREWLKIKSTCPICKKKIKEEWIP